MSLLHRHRGVQSSRGAEPVKVPARKGSRPGPDFAFHLSSFLLPAALALAPSPAQAAPAWWTGRGVLDPASAPADYAPANLGQLKWFATNACAELNQKLALFGGAGTGVTVVVSAFTRTNSWQAANLGQLKQVAQPVYDRLIQIGFTNAYPWTAETTNDADQALVNLGQLKLVFDFDISLADSDEDQLPDWWEQNHFGNLSQTAASDPDGDGLDNAGEIAASTRPTQADTDGDTLPDGWEVTHGLDPLANDAAADADDDGMPNLWEYQHDLDPLDDDALLDPDADSYPNIYEYIHDSNPTDWSSVPATSEMIHVAPNGSATPPYDSWETAATSIQAGVDYAANDYDIVLVKDGTYQGAGNEGIDAQGGKIMIRSENGASHCRLDLQGTAFLALSGETPATIIRGFEMVGGNGVWCYGSSPTVEACIIRNGSQGVYCEGAYWWEEEQGLTQAVSPIVRNCVIVQTVEGVTILGRSSVNPPVAESAPVIEHCTIANNRNWGIYLTACGGRVEGSVVWGQFLDDADIIFDSGSSTEVSYSCIQYPSTGGTGNISSDPRLDVAFRLLPDSPCIDALTVTNAPLRDIAGTARWDHGAPSGDTIADMGAYEFVDFDGDGLPDDWEMANGLDPALDDAAADADDDGLSNRQEYEFGSDPTRQDSDEDGIPDHTEWVVGSDPWRVDTDGDGLSDAEEFTRGSDPRSFLTGRQTGTVSDGQDPASFDTSAAYSDADHDRMLDTWEARYGSPAWFSSTGDRDQDGYSDMTEFIAGSNPNNAQSTPSCAFDLDVDSDHSSDFGGPQRNDLEESIEDSPVLYPQFAGQKYVVLNDYHDLTDTNGVPGYADGWNCVDTLPADDVMPGRYAPTNTAVFVPVVLALSHPGYTLSEPRIHFEYNASAPVVGDGFQRTGRIRLWQKPQFAPRDPSPVGPSGGDLIPPEAEYSPAELGFTAMPQALTFWVECTDVSTNLADIRLNVDVHSTNWATCSSDTVYLTGIQADVDVDTLNTRGFDLPDNSTDADRFEDQTNALCTLTGKIIAVNDGDLDGDGIVDFADGFNSLGSMGVADDLNSSQRMARVVFRISPAIDLSLARVRLSYPASDPAMVAWTLHIATNTVNGTMVTNRVLTFTPPGGMLRIWTADPRGPRTNSAVVAGGDYLAPGVYSAAQFGFANGLREVAYWVEAVSNSTHAADCRILYEVDPTGTQTEPPGFIAADAVRLTLHRADVDVDTDNTDGLNLPDRSLLEDRFEDITNVVNTVAGKIVGEGKLVGVSDGDADRDGIPDYADGFDLLGGGAQADNLSATATLARVVFELAPETDVTRTWVRVSYPASDPMAMVWTAYAVTNWVGGSPVTNAWYHFEPAPGMLRIWTKAPWLPRSGLSVTSGGDYLAPGDYLAQDIGFTATRRTVAFWMEGISNSVHVGDCRIVFQTDPLGVSSYPSPSRSTDAARVTILKVESVKVRSPEGSDWAVNYWGNVILKDDDLRVQAQITPSVASMSAISGLFSATVRKLSIDSTGAETVLKAYEVPITTANASLVDGNKIRLTIPAATVASEDLVSNTDDSGTTEFTSCDSSDQISVPAGDSNRNDSDRFDGHQRTAGYVQRGLARGTTGDSSLTPPEGAFSQTFMKAAGVLYFDVEVGGTKSDLHQIQEQADTLYYSGHGFHDANYLQVPEPGSPASSELRAADVAPYWNDLETVIIAGCSVLDIGDYNNHFPGNTSPGKQWMTTGATWYFGYNAWAPTDSRNGDQLTTAKIIGDWSTKVAAGVGTVTAWKEANLAATDANGYVHGRNACSIYVPPSGGNKIYCYFDEDLFGNLTWTCVLESDWP